MADLLHQRPGRLGRGPVHALADEQPPLVPREELRAVDGVPVEPLVPLDEVEVVGPHGRAVLELDEAPEEEGHVEIQHAVRLVHAVRPERAGRGHHPALLQQRRQRGDLQDQPALLDVHGAGPLAARPVGDAGVEHPRHPGLLERQAHVQVVGHVRRRGVLLGVVRMGHDVGGRRDRRIPPVAVRVGELVPPLLRHVLPDGVALDDPAVHVAQAGRAVPQDVLDAGLLGHERVAPLAARVRLIQILLRGARVGQVGRGQHELQQAVHVQAVRLRGPGPRGGARLPVGGGAGRVVVQHRHAALVEDDVVRVGDGEPPADIVVVPVPRAHVPDGVPVVRHVEHMRLLDPGREVGRAVRRLDVTVAHKLGVEEQHAQDALPVEELDLAHVRQEGRAAREAEPALQFRHAPWVGGSFFF